MDIVLFGQKKILIADLDGMGEKISFMMLGFGIAFIGIFTFGEFYS